MSTQAGLMLDDMCAVRSSYASLRRLVNAVTTKVKLDLADYRLQGTLPPGLRPYVERVYVRATTYKQLRALGDRLSGVPSASALELELSFGRNQDLYLDRVREALRHAGLTERVRAVKYRCQSVHGTNLFPGEDVPVSAELWPAHTSSPPAAFWRTLFNHSLVELQITVWKPEHALHSLKFALRCGDRICGTLRCLQVDRTYEYGPSLPMHVFTEFLVGLKLPRLVHLGSNISISQPHQSVWEWPQKESVPTLQSFGGTRKPEGIFGLGTSGVHLSYLGVYDAQNMVAMADSALGPAIRELHVTMKDFETTWEGIPAVRSVLGFIALLKSVQQLRIEGCEGTQVLVRAEAINALDGLQKLALGCVTIEGDLTGPCLTEIVCLSLQTQLRTVLARPPLVPHSHTVVPRAVLGISVPRVTEVVRACPGAPRWTISHDISMYRSQMYYLVRAVPCRG